MLQAISKLLGLDENRTVNVSYEEYQKLKEAKTFIEVLRSSSIIVKHENEVEVVFSEDNLLKFATIFIGAELGHPVDRVTISAHNHKRDIEKIVREYVRIIKSHEVDIPRYHEIKTILEKHTGLTINDNGELLNKSPLKI